MPSIYLVRENRYNDNDTEWDATISDEHPAFTDEADAQKLVDKLNDNELNFWYGRYVARVEEGNLRNAPLREALEAAKATGNETLINAVRYAPEVVEVLSKEEYRKLHFEDDQNYFYDVVTLVLN